MSNCYILKPFIYQTETLGRTESLILKTRARERTVSFQDVYQNGQALRKHFIFWSKEVSPTFAQGSWCILHCIEHGVGFTHSRPHFGAIAHLRSKAHNDPTSNDAFKGLSHVVEKFGFRVLDCNEELAKLNNDAYIRAVKAGAYRPPNDYKRLMKNWRLSCSFEKTIQTSPELGKIYAAPHPECDGLHLVVVLPQPGSSLQKLLHQSESLLQPPSENPAVSEIPVLYLNKDLSFSWIPESDLKLGPIDGFSSGNNPKYIMNEVERARAWYSWIKENKELQEGQFPGSSPPPPRMYTDEL